MRSTSSMTANAAYAASAHSSKSLWRPQNATIDWPLLFIVSALTLLGLVMVTSASLSIAERNFNDAFYFAKRQFFFVVLAALLAWFVFQIRMNIWERLSFYLLLVAIVLAAVVLIPGVGKTVNGSTRWLNFGVFNFQVSEMVKFMVLVYIAGYLVRHGDEIRSRFFGFIKPIGVLCVIGVLLMLEPDFGATVVVMATAMGVMFLGGVPFSQFFILIVGFIGSVILLAMSSEYRMERITSFLNPWADPYGSGFQLTQSLIAIGSGAWTGLGLGGSVQKLFYLPEAHTDFLFAVMAEELGLVGSIVIVVLYAAFVWRIFDIANRARQAGKAFSTYLAMGFGLWLALQAFINIGVNMGILPTKGLTLPLMSYGGSSMLMTAAVVGVLFRISHESAVADVQAMRRTRATKTSKRAKT
ncbi:MAG: putative lipid II flippase FtsW [Pseudomonadota bacterium]